jgi:hypothetical protein
MEMRGEFQGTDIPRDTNPSFTARREAKLEEGRARQIGFL